MRKFAFVAVLVFLTFVFVIYAPQESSRELDAYAQMDTTLLVPQRNVVLATVDLKATGLTLL